MSKFEKGHASDVVNYAASPITKGKSYHITTREALVLTKLIHYSRTNNYIYYSNATIGEHVFLTEGNVKKLMTSLGQKGYLTKHTKTFWEDGVYKKKRSCKIAWDQFSNIQSEIDQYLSQNGKTKSVKPTGNIENQVECALNEQKDSRDFNEEERRVIMEKVRARGIDHPEEIIFDPNNNVDLDVLLYDGKGCYYPKEGVAVNRNGLRIECVSDNFYSLMINDNRKERISCNRRDLEKWMELSLIEFKDLSKEHFRIISFGIPKMN